MNSGQIVVWDPLVRIFHWSLVISCAVAWLTAENFETLHNVSGYLAAALLGFRLVWGVIGSHHARFRHFVRGPSAVIAYARDMLNRSEPRCIGHNPLGAAMIIALLLALGIITVTGWMYTLDTFWGVDWVEAVHEATAELMLFMVVLHIAGVMYASFHHRENLIRAMIKGTKRENQDDAPPSK